MSTASTSGNSNTSDADSTSKYKCIRDAYNRLKRLSCGHPVPSDCVNSRFLQPAQFHFHFSALHVFPQAAGYLSPHSSLSCFANDQLLPGLLLFPRIVRGDVCRRLFNYFLHEAPFEHSHLLRSNVPLPPDDTHSLRWLTFGYHHNWNTKVYSEDAKDEVPHLITELLNCLTTLLAIEWKAEAGIVNYYTCKSRIGPHVDFSERDKQAPLLSLSFGSDAIFLIAKDNEEPLKLVLGDGDLLVMGGCSRLAVHAVPKVYCGENTCSNDIIRVNLNARQVNFLSSTSNSSTCESGEMSK